MNFSLGGSPTSHTSESSVASATSTRKHLGKFESRCDVGFLIGYPSNSKAYRVFNNATRMIEETCDVEFDETNGSQGEEFSCDDVGDEPLREVTKNIAIG